MIPTKDKYKGLPWRYVRGAYPPPTKPVEIDDEEPPVPVGIDIEARKKVLENRAKENLQNNGGASNV